MISGGVAASGVAKLLANQATPCIGVHYPDSCVSGEIVVVVEAAAEVGIVAVDEVVVVSDVAGLAPSLEGLAAAIAVSAMAAT